MFSVSPAECAENTTQALNHCMMLQGVTGDDPYICMQYLIFTHVLKLPYTSAI